MADQNLLLKWLRDAQEMRGVGQNALTAVTRGIIPNALGGPVDLANLGVNAAKAAYGYAGHKGGLLSAEQMPQLDERPVGGSEWIADKMQQGGLLGSYRNPLAETIAGGLLGPMAGAAVANRAPQIARGLLQMGENAASPSTMANQGQRGMILYHGTNGINPIRKIEADGQIGGRRKRPIDGLFTSTSHEVAGGHGENIYRMTVPDETIADGSLWKYADTPEAELKIVAAIKSRLGNTKISDDVVDAIMTDRNYKFHPDPSIEAKQLEALANELPGARSQDYADILWELQNQRGLAAKDLGFKAVAMNDEHGTSYLIPHGVGVSPRPYSASAKEISRGTYDHVAVRAAENARAEQIKAATDAANADRALAARKMMEKINLLPADQRAEAERLMRYGAKSRVENNRLYAIKQMLNQL